MTNFTVLTDEQAAHDAATSKRHLEALRELQAENARLRAHIQEAADKAQESLSFCIEDRSKDHAAMDAFYNRRNWHLAALGETK